MTVERNSIQTSASMYSILTERLHLDDPRRVEGLVDVVLLQIQQALLGVAVAQDDPHTVVVYALPKCEFEFE